jgi:hypothetical protein
MRADNKAFAKAVGNFLIFSLQMHSNMLSLFKHFGKKMFQTALGKAPNR